VQKVGRKSCFTHIFDLICTPTDEKQTLCVAAYAEAELLALDKNNNFQAHMPAARHFLFILFEGTHRCIYAK
jgi:hypothetical protein